MQRIRVRVGLTLEVFRPGDVFFWLLEPYVRVDLMRSITTASSPSSATEAAATTAATGSTATTSVSVLLHSF